MKLRTYIKNILLGVLLPILLLLVGFRLRFKELPDWSGDVYSFVLWPLVAIAVLLVIAYFISYFVDTRMR